MGHGYKMYYEISKFSSWPKKQSLFGDASWVFGERFNRQLNFDTSAMDISDESCPEKIDGQLKVRFSLSSPDLVVCMSSPDVSTSTYKESPEFSRDNIIDISLEDGIKGSEMKDFIDSPDAKMEDMCTETCFDLVPKQVIRENDEDMCTEKSGFSDGGEMLHKLQTENELQKKELLDTKKALEELHTEYNAKSRECQEAWKSLNQLKNELMRKSMHVGSLAFAIEGQVKEKTKWFSSLGDLTQKLKILKMDHFSLVEEASLFQQYMSEMEGVRSAIHSRLHEHLQSHEDIGFKFLQAEKQRKELYNKVVEMKGNIRVFCRCRPLNAEEIVAEASMAVDFEGRKDGEITLKSNGMPKKTFKFDAVFLPEADQVEVFEETAPLANSVLDGYNVCIFAYGQTGTGKTFTMEGTAESRGVNYRTLEKLFDIIQDRRSTFQYQVSVSVLEIYNEQIRDLLASASTAKKLEIKQAGDGGHHVPGLVEAQVNNVTEVWKVLQRGSHGRTVGLTNANEHSSRSHCMHCVMVKAENLINGESTRSKLWLVDLAGSERIDKTEVQGERLRETQNINRSLSALGDVISALANKSPHIPYRNSKLTHLLQDSLGGDSKALMFVQISPNENDLNETLCSLNFASRVRGIELGTAKKQMDKTEFLKNRQMVEKLKQDMKTKEYLVKKLEDTNYGLEVKIKDREMKNRSLQEKIKELESQLMVERKLARQHVDFKIAEQLFQNRVELKHQQQEEQKSYFTARAPLAVKTHIPEWKGKDQENIENNEEFSFFPPAMAEKHQNSSKISVDKENNPDIAQQLNLPKETGRASLCPQKIISTTAPRRGSLIPLSNSHLTTKLTPFPDDDADESGFETTYLPEQVTCGSHKDNGDRSVKVRRSLQRKNHTRQPMPPLRRIGVNVCTERLSVSIGRGKNGQRMFLSNARRAVAKETQLQKQSQREKERGWNNGGAVRTLI